MLTEYLFAGTQKYLQAANCKEPDDRANRAILSKFNWILMKCTMNKTMSWNSNIKIFTNPVR